MYKLNKKLFNEALESKYGNIKSQSGRDKAAARDLIGPDGSHWSIKEWRQRNGSTPRDRKVRANIEEYLNTHLPAESKGKLFYSSSRASNAKRVAKRQPKRVAAQNARISKATGKPVRQYHRKGATVIPLQPTVRAHRATGKLLSEIEGYLKEIKTALILSLSEETDFTNANPKLALLDKVADLELDVRSFDDNKKG